jgi:hypothetical protein
MLAASSNPIRPAAQAPGALPGPGGLVFQRGHFQVRDELLIALNAMTIYSDGIVIDTSSSTDDGDRFGQDLLESAAREFSLSYDSETVRRKLYLSELIVRSDISMDALNAVLTRFASELSDAIDDDPRPRFRVAGLSFSTDPHNPAAHKILVLERQAGKSFDERRYYSQAPLQTDVHFGLLEDLEKAILGA